MENKLREEIKITPPNEQILKTLEAYFKAKASGVIIPVELDKAMVALVTPSKCKTNTDKEELPDLSKIKPKMIDVEKTVRLAEEIRKEQGDTDKEGASR